MVAAISCVGLDSAYAQVTRPDISTELSPVADVTVVAEDGHDVIAVLRAPPGDGPFPAVIALHGGLITMTREYLRDQALNNPTMTRLLANGYVTVIPTFRRRDIDPQARDALLDNLAILEYVKQLDYVDPHSVAIYGCSGGGDLALEISGEADVAAVTSEEPATVLFTGMLGSQPPRQGETYGVPDIVPLYEDTQAYYTRELQAFTREKIHKIDEPVFFAQGDQLLANTVDHIKMENEIVIREMDAAAKDWRRSVYPGQTHCFGLNGLTEASRDFFSDMDAFFRQHLPTPPIPLDRSLVNYVEVVSP